MKVVENIATLFKKTLRFIAFYSDVQPVVVAKLQTEFFGNLLFIVFTHIGEGICLYTIRMPSKKTKPG